MGFISQVLLESFAKIDKIYETFNLVDSQTYTQTQQNPKPTYFAVEWYILKFGFFLLYKRKFKKHTFFILLEN